jgi:hypothetical protein
MIAFLIFLAIVAVVVYSHWKLYEKAGKPGWAAIIPVYNLYILIKIVEKPDWWIALCFVPIANLVVFVILYIELAKKFGKSAGYGLGMVVLPFIFIPMLAFSDATYQGTTNTNTEKYE